MNAARREQAGTFRDNAPQGALEQIIVAGMPNYRQCTRCIMDTTDPLIEFDGSGVCNHCRKVEGYRTWWRPEGNQAALEGMIEKIKEDGMNHEFDVVMGLSGGVDSSYVALKAKDWGLRALVIHVDTGWNSELAVSNIENIVRRLGFELATEVVDWSEMRDLQLAFLKAGVPNQDIPQDHAIAAGFYNFAAKSGVRWALSGSNIACEGILPVAWGYDNLDWKHIAAIHRRFGSIPLKSFPKMSYLQYGVVHQLIKRVNIARPLNFIRYNKADAIRELVERVGWQYYGGKHFESRFTKFFQGYFLPKTWGYDKRLAHLSSLIVSGQITREEALTEMSHDAVTDAEMADELDYLARKFELTKDELHHLLNGPTRQHNFYPHTSTLAKRVLMGGARFLRSWRSSRKD